MALSALHQYAGIGDLVFPGGRGKCFGNSRRISDIRLELVFRGAHEECAHKTNEISAFGSELVFRDIPGKLVQWGRYAQRGRRPWLRRTLLDPIAPSVFGVDLPPLGLRLLAPRRLAFRFAAGALPRPHSNIRPKPATAYAARSLPGIGHGDRSIVTNPRPPAPNRQLKVTGSVLESTGGLLLASAEVLELAELPISRRLHRKKY